MRNYSEELKDPRWQKRRLEILNRDSFTCRICGCGLGDGKPLNVHHVSYKPNLKPWEYPDNMLVTLCEDCHKKAHKKHGELTKADVEPFFFTYNEFILNLFNTNMFNTTTKVLYKLLEFAEYNTGKVYMSSERVKEILQICKISRASYQRAMSDLVREEIISKNGTTYAINEDMFWKGDKKTREALRETKLNTTISPDYNTEG